MQDLTEAQREQSQAASAAGQTFASVTYEMLLKDHLLAQRVYSINPQRYREIRETYEFTSGLKRRPEGFFDR
jgi:hypothetical protein